MRLMALSTDKEETKAAYAQYFGHTRSVSSEVNSASVEGVLMVTKLNDRHSARNVSGACTGWGAQIGFWKDVFFLNPNGIPQQSPDI